MRERITCAYGLVVISPTSNLFIQLHNQNILLPRFSSAENRVRDIGNDSLNCLLTHFSGMNDMKHLDSR